MSKLPYGFHVDSQASDAIGLTRKEVEEERAARGELVNKRKAPRGPKLSAPVRPPFDEMLRTIGILDWIQPLCRERGVLVHELQRGTKAARVMAVRKLVWAELRSRSWSYEQIAQLFEYGSHTAVLDALNGGNKRGQRAATKRNVSEQ